MRILNLEYEDQPRRWHLEPMAFHELTLLVGASGVGKTQILRSILRLKSISRGLPANGLEWTVKFSFSNGDHYQWKGKFESRPLDPERFLSSLDAEEGDESDACNIIYEELLCNDEKIIVRDSAKILFQGTETVKLPQQKSAIYLLKEEERISPVHNGFQSIILHDDSQPGLRIDVNGRVGKAERYDNIEKIRASRENLRTKLYLASLHAPDVFDEIRTQFMAVFPYVEDVKLEPLSPRRMPAPFKEVPFIHIKERGVDEWIDEFWLSSGMRRSLLHIGALHLCADGTVILVDEFENSLGVNCIGEVTDQIVLHERPIQFIVTSHHPYIINNISHKNWKIVTRRAGTVTARDASEFRFGQSKHDAFLQLINIDAYSEGIEL
jgi:hypothetical protein